MKTFYSFYLPRIKHLNRCQLVFRLLIILFGFISELTPAEAQDTTKITYSLEMDTLVKQRFIDRYENVFMTKVPTRHMFKIGISQYYQANPFPLRDNNLLNMTSLQVGYEFKFLPAFSVALSGHAPFYGTDLPLKTSWEYTVFDGQLRWYFDMKKRIRSGKGANNFSGNYIALSYTTAKTESYSNTIGLKWGFQRRFLNSGYIDFAFALQQDAPFFHYGILENWSFSSQTSFGFAFGDWKKSGKAPLCDLLLCDEQLKDQWKIRLPELTFGYYLNRIKLGVAYERKIKTSPFSLNYQLDIGLNRGFDYIRRKNKHPNDFYSKYQVASSAEISQTLSIQPRYYFLQNRQKIRAAGGNGLSGVYAGINGEYNFYSGRHNPYQEGKNTTTTQNNVRTGLLLGFQQRLFAHGYIDFNTSYNYQIDLNTSTNSFGLQGNLGLGFAF